MTDVSRIKNRYPMLPGDEKLCVHPVRLAAGDTMTRRQRVHNAMRKRRDPHTCNARAYWMVDGQPYCQNHGGQLALKILSGEITS